MVGFCERDTGYEPGVKERERERERELWMVRVGPHQAALARGGAANWRKL